MSLIDRFDEIHSCCCALVSVRFSKTADVFIGLLALVALADKLMNIVNGPVCTLFTEVAEITSLFIHTVAMVTHKCTCMR